MRRRNGRLVVVLVSVVAGMIGLAYASAPLYRAFCQVTGFAGTPRTNDVALPATVGDGAITVRFDANVNSALPWRFRPAQKEITLRLGEPGLAHYTAANLSDVPLVGTATFNVTPHKAAQYFAKVECFCFSEQRLEPGQEASLPVSFYVDPAITEDANARDVGAITLSYTFFPAGERS
jgi:cytochrome c oxidase assembly protein subunit 11